MKNILIMAVLLHSEVKKKIAFDYTHCFRLPD
jgi:hypothetical protein